MASRRKKFPSRRETALPFRGNEIDRIGEFIRLVDDLPTLQISKLSVRLLPPVLPFDSKPKALSFDLDRETDPNFRLEFEQHENGYRRTLKLEVKIPGHYDRHIIQIGGRNAIEEDWALDFLNLTISCDLADPEQPDCLSLFNELFPDASPPVKPESSESQRRFSALRLLVLGISNDPPSSEMLSQLRVRTEARLKSHPYRYEAAWLTVLLQDLCSTKELEYFARQYDHLRGAAQQAFAPILKRIFDGADLTGESEREVRGELAGKVLLRAQELMLRAREGQIDKAIFEELMHLCECFWFCSSVGQKELGSLHTAVAGMVAIFRASSHSKGQLINDAVMAVLVTFCRTLLQAKERGSVDQKFVAEIRQYIFELLDRLSADEKDFNLRITCMISLGYLYSKGAPPNREAFSALAGCLRLNVGVDHQRNAFHAASANSWRLLVSSLTNLSQLDKEARLIAIDIYRKIAQNWATAVDFAPRRAAAKALVVGLNAQFPVTSVFHVLASGRDTDAGNSILSVFKSLRQSEIHNIGFDVDLPSIVVVGLCEMPLLGLALLTRLLPHYRRYSDLACLQSFFQNYFRAEQLRTATSESNPEVEECYSGAIKDMEDAENHVDEDLRPFVRLIGVAATGRLEMFRALKSEGKLGVRPPQLDVAMNCFDKINQQYGSRVGHLHPLDVHIIAAMTSILTGLSTIEFWKGDYVSLANAQLKSSTAYYFMDARRQALVSHSPHLREILTKRTKDIYTPTPSVNAHTFHAPLVAPLHPTDPSHDVEVKAFEVFLEMTIGRGLSWWRSRKINALVNVVPTVIKDIQVAPLRPIGLLAYGSFVQW